MRFSILPVLCSSKPLFPTPLLVSPKFPHVPLGIGEWPLGYKQRRYWANYLSNKFPRFNLCDRDPPTLQMGGQTDGWTTCDRKTALCTIVHHMVKSLCCLLDCYILRQLTTKFLRSATRLELLCWSVVLPALQPSQGVMSISSCKLK